MTTRNRFEAFLLTGPGRLCRFILPLVVLVLSLGLTYMLWEDAQKNALKELKASFIFRQLEAAEKVNQRMLDYDQMLRGLRGLFRASESVNREEFREYFKALNIFERYKGIQALGFVEHVPVDEKNRHIAKIQQEGFPNYQIWPDTPRQNYAPVVYIEPFDTVNRRAFGFDISSEAARHTALEAARDSNSTIITSKISLVQRDIHNKSAALIIMLPVYKNGAPHDTVVNRRASLVGWVDAVLRIEPLMDGVLGLDDPVIDIEIFDGPNISPASLLYDKDKFLRHRRNMQLFQTTQQLKIAGRIWTLRTSSLPAFENRLDRSKPRQIALTGLIISLVLTAMTLFLVRARMRSVQATRRLSEELHARIAAEESLKLAAMVYDNSSEGILVTDANNRIIAINPAFTRLTGYEINDIAGKDPSFFKSGKHGDLFYEAMWAEINQTGHWQGEVWDLHKDGTEHAKYLTINTIYNDDGSVYRRVALFMDISEKKETEEVIWRQANFDALTQLPNRSMFHHKLMLEIEQAKRNNSIFALLFIDLDLFKEINDTLGHHVGDLLLVEAAQRILACVRKSDMVARLGGDEFTVILTDQRQDDGIGRVAEKILTSLAAPYKLKDEVVYITGSIGITIYPQDAGDPEGLLKNADQAMYVAKNMGRNQISYFTQALQESAQTRLRMINDLREAIAKQQFVVHYQPIVDLSNGEIHKAEALVRWHHPKKGLIPPNEFILLAEETGLISNIGDWVFRESAREVKHLRERYHPHFQISVNKSPIQFRDSGQTLVAWFDYLKELQLPGESIAIEITEGLLLNAVSDVTDKLRLFRESGVQIAIDDFGTGYSSLSYLKRFDIDYLKIDQSFVRDIEFDPNDLALTRAIILMAHALNLKVIAEGVETATQLALLRKEGCDFAQGYFFSRPLTAEMFEDLLGSKPRSAA